MSKLQKWLIIIGCIILAILIMTYGCELVFDYGLGPLPVLIVVFVLYGIGRVWTRSPSGQTESPAAEDEAK